MNIQIFSLPQQFVIPNQDWLKTPDVNARVNRAARSYFANWTLSRLVLTKALSVGGGAISLIGIGIACYMRHIPSLVIGGLSFVICLIGYDAVQRESRARLEKTCLAIEDWLIPLKKTCEELDPLLTASFKDNAQPNHPVPFATYQSIYDLTQQLPNDLDQQIKLFAGELNGYHLALFGMKRQVGQGQMTNHWILYTFREGLGSPLRHFYASVKTFQQCFVKLQQDPQNINYQKDIYMAAHLSYQYGCKSAQKISIADLLEKSRQSIAAFRSSLNL